jgi:hypothetical protein
MKEITQTLMMLLVFWQKPAKTSIKIIKNSKKNLGNKILVCEAITQK